VTPDLYLAAYEAAANVIARADSLDAATEGVLRGFCSTLQWDVGVGWVVERANRLRCSAVVIPGAVGFDAFAAASREKPLAFGEGFPGIVARDVISEWIENVAVDPRMPRAATAASDGLRSGVAFPLILEGKVLGVLELYSRGSRAKDPRELAVLDSIGTLLGLFIRRANDRDEGIRSEARLRALVDSSLDAVVSTDALGNVVEFSLAAERMFGYTREHAVGRNMGELIVPPEQRAAHQAGHNRVVAGGPERVANRRLEMTAMRADGSFFPVELTITRVHGSGWGPGEPIYTGYMRDITDRQRLQEQNRFVGEASRQLGESLDFETAIASLVRLAVPKLADWCAVELVRGEGKTEQIAVAHTDPAKVELAKELRTRWPSAPDSPQGVPAVIRTGKIQSMSDIPDEFLARLAKDSEHLRLLRTLGLRSFVIVPIATHGRVLGALTLVNAESGRQFDASDIAFAEDFAARAASALENARLYQDAQEANRLKDEFLATLSHELRTPLNAIVGWSHMLRSGALDETARVRAAEIIDRNARLQAQLVNDVLDVSRIVTGKLTLDVQEVDAAKIVAGSLETIRHAADGKRIRVQARVDPFAGSILGDPARLQQIIWNLLSNAIKFTEKGGRVEIAVAEVGEQMEIRVTDSGQGIERAFLPHVFERFRQGDSTTTREHGGLGLGLAIVRHLVEIHGGTVHAESEGIGKGSTFIVRLPRVTRLSQEAGPTDRPRAAISRGLEGIHVLVVDDQSDARELVASVLRQGGADVEIAESAADALAQLGRSPHQILISDIGMPGTDGYALIRAVRASSDEFRKIPALALTAYARHEDRQKALSEGFNEHMPKPIEPDLLLRAVAGLTGRA